MTQPERTTSQWKIILLAATVITIFGMVAVVASADDRADRLDRKIRVMEGIFDQVLIDSPNVAVSPGSGITRGLALDGYGVVLTIDGRLNTGRGWHQPFAFAFEADADFADSLAAIEILEERQLMGIEEREKREQEREARRQASEQRRRELEEQRRALEARQQEMKKQRQELVAQQGELRAALVKELTDTLIDFGATLVELPDDATIAVAAFLDQSPFVFPGENQADRIVITARMGDLRRYAGGAMDRPTMVSKVTTKITASD
jgi:hypothetical protein